MDGFFGCNHTTDSLHYGFGEPVTLNEAKIYEQSMRYQILVLIPNYTYIKSSFKIHIHTHVHKIYLYISLPFLLYL